MTMKKLYIIVLKVLLIIVLFQLKAISEEKIKIGLIVPLSGEYSYIGKSILKSCFFFGNLTSWLLNVS